MVNDSSKGKFRYVIIHKLDRFSRDRYDSVTYKRKLKMNGVTLRSVLENLDGSPESQILESLLEGMAAYYSQNLSRECLKGLLENGHKCIHNGGIPPLGYDIDKTTRTYILNEKEAPIVREIFSKYAEGVGYKQIIGYLNDMGYRSKRGRDFGKNSIHEILKNPKYTGLYTYNLRTEKTVSGTRNPQFKPKEEWICIPGGVPAIVDEDIFNQVQRRLVENRKCGGRSKAKRIYLLSGLVRCGECGASMYGKSRRDGRHGIVYLSYECSGKNFKKNCHNKEIRKEYLENYVLDQVYKNLFSENSIERLSSLLISYSRQVMEDVNREFKEANQELHQINDRVNKIIHLVSESGISIDTVKGEMKLLEKRRHNVEEVLQELRMRQTIQTVSEDKIVDLIHRSKEVVKARNIKECRDIIANYVERVIVSNEKIEIFYKIQIPDEQHNLTLLKSVGDIKVIKEVYSLLAD
jgi:site-specific DNA recombinase